jgi:uncharacterized protein YdcH (DUF465 family)
MNDTQKANVYGQLLNEHRRLHNLIAEIKGQNVDLTKLDIQKIQDLEKQQVKIMNDINRLLS